MLLIVGLGNPGREFFNTRHNIGFIIADKFISSLGIKKLKARFGSEYCRAALEGKDLLIVKPLTFMNNSGYAVSRIINYYRKKIESMIVIHDDMDIDFENIRFKRGGTSGGHNGLESIIKSIKTDKFDRLRFGVGRPPSGKDPAEYVLSAFKKNEEKKLDFLVESSVDALRAYIIDGIDSVMNTYNRR